MPIKIYSYKNLKTENTKKPILTLINNIKIKIITRL